MADDDDFEWEPPSEAEMKVIQARREREDKVSKLMGNYLLKGYKMLGECCELCGTILLQDKQQKYYCVSCQELDSDVDKDNPALNAQAALSQVRERQLASQASVPPQANGDHGNSHGSESIGQPRPEYCEGAAAGRRGLLAAAAPSVPVGPALTALSAAVPVSVNHNHSSPRSALLEAEEALLAKLQWASCELKTATSLEGSIQLCNLITSCAQSLRSLRELSQSPL